MKFSKVTALFLSMLFAQSSFAGLEPEKFAERGRPVQPFLSPAGGTEECITPARIGVGDYSEKDGENEQKLCSFDMHGQSAMGDGKLKSVAVCVKKKSSNPALELYKVEKDLTKEQIEAAECKDADKLAKYKVSSSCSYTPAMLSYYHISRFLGNVLHIPTYVLRTYERKAHLAYAEHALDILKPKKGEKPELIYDTWTTLHGVLKTGGNSERRDRILTEDETKSYGGLYVPAKKEFFYEEFFHKGKVRAVEFKNRNPYYKIVTTEKPLASFVKKDWNAENIQQVVSATEVSEMLVIDDILSQADRFGNIDALEYYYYQVNGEIKTVLKHKADPAEMEKVGAFVVKEAVLQDNDCGIVKENINKGYGLTVDIRHMNQGFYLKFQDLANFLKTPFGKEHFQKEYLHTDADFKTVSERAIFLAEHFKTLCKSGKLFLDLNLKQHTSGQYDHSQRKCE